MYDNMKQHLIIQAVLILLVERKSVTHADPTVATATVTNDGRSSSTGAASTGFETPIPGDDVDITIMNVAGADLGVPQTVDVRYPQEILAVIHEGRNYFEDWVKRDPFYAPVVELCKNQHENCALWAALGECEKNAAYMKHHCPIVCKSCEVLHHETKCPVDSTNIQEDEVAWRPGDLDKMFQRITTDPTIQELHQPTVLQRPTYANGDTEETATYNLGFWVVTLDNFLTQQETEQIVRLGHQAGFNRSASDVGKASQDGSFTRRFDEDRTSENTWCKRPCYEDPIVQRVLQKMYHVTQIHDKHAENLQILKYEPQQYYKPHIDYIFEEKSRMQGVRILTMYLYLSDVEEGGGTNFPQMDLTVMPKRGRALLWPSVLNEAPNSMDARTVHQALPVLKGIKYGANAWYHMRDFKTPLARGCA
ncbi:Prolyl 4-hydroxylase subunit alpha-1 [Seminavis robusta]|uniref:Prolyl 4-hydroxylase subunit alpha-1 n=1 Tax=Seminavis robusta TaxID=568900 RepID=A0A9N8HHG4_9STRA|nr:Prolyl 4-hydroxylase subunit alpha-1 [Seminavis robusta]|eukprot:Sro705_g190330.1 Prolyl 4-hydroxylase subunit alpha-1 (421) ;mRNA; f:21572-22934